MYWSTPWSSILFFCSKSARLLFWPGRVLACRYRAEIWLISDGICPKAAANSHLTPGYLCHWQKQSRILMVVLHVSSTYRMNSCGPSSDPWGTPQAQSRQDDRTPLGLWMIVPNAYLDSCSTYLLLSVVFEISSGLLLFQGRKCNFRIWRSGLIHQRLYDRGTICSVLFFFWYKFSQGLFL